MTVVLLLVVGCGTQTSQDVSEEIKIGDITFDRFGDKIVDLFLKTVKDGKFVHLN